MLIVSDADTPYSSFSANQFGDHWSLVFALVCHLNLLGISDHVKILHVVERLRIVKEATDISLNNKLSIALHPIYQVKRLQWEVSRDFVDGDV